MYSNKKRDVHQLLVVKYQYCLLATCLLEIDYQNCVVSCDQLTHDLYTRSNISLIVNIKKKVYDTLVTFQKLKFVMSIVNLQTSHLPEMKSITMYHC